jgi:hypothetical protein
MRRPDNPCSAALFQGTSAVCHLGARGKILATLAFRTPAPSPMPITRPTPTHSPIPLRPLFARFGPPRPGRSRNLPPLRTGAGSPRRARDGGERASSRWLTDLGQLDESHRDVGSASPLSHVTPPSDASTGVVCAPVADEFAPHFAKLGKIASTPSLWPSDGTRPFDEAIESARRVLAQFQYYGLVPSRVVASAEGGVAICVVKDGKYADIECLNSGALLAVNSDKFGSPEIWEIRPETSDIALSISRIRRFISR